MWFNIIANLRYLQYYSRMEDLGQHSTQNKYTLFVYVVKYTLLSYSVAMTVNHKTANTIYSSHFRALKLLMVSSTSFSSKSDLLKQRNAEPFGQVFISSSTNKLLQTTLCKAAAQRRVSVSGGYLRNPGGGRGSATHFPPIDETLSRYIGWFKISVIIVYKNKTHTFEDVCKHWILYIF